MLPPLACARPASRSRSIPITTAGDRDRTKPFGEIGSRGVFVKELEEALLEHRIDIAVHSAKDMTASDPEGLVVGAYLERDDPRDALVGADAIRAGMRVGTASARRKAQLLALEPSLSIEPLRGNIDTRLRKRVERGLDAVVLAACGLDRLGLAREIGKRFDPDELLPEAAQGALALQVREGEQHLVAAADHGETRRRVEAERATVAAVGGGCLAPVAAYHDGVTLTGLDRGRRRLLARAQDRRRSGRARACARSARAVKVVVTRSDAQADELVARLEALGHAVVRCPLIRVEPLGDEPIDPSPYDWVVVTSPNGARELARRLAGTPKRLAAIGPGTADALREEGLQVDLVPQTHTQEGLAAELPPGRILLAAAEGARRLLVEERGADFLPLYRTVELRPPAPDGDVALLASASAARALAATGARLPVVAIGPRTAAEAREHGLDVVAVAESYDLEGLLDVVSSL